MTRRWDRVRIRDAALYTFGVLVMLGAIALVVAPIFIRTDTFGIHDWDQMEAHRYLVIKTIERFHQIPFWNPYSCGGHTWWGGMESGSSFVSPFLPLYLLAPFTWALRLEVVFAALLSAVGTWLFVGRFTRSAGIRALVAVAFAVDGRFSLQASVGHAWHLYYAWMPWALFFLDRAIAMAPNASGQTRFPLRDVTLLGVTLAMMVYTGGIYPLPQTVFLIAVYAISCALAARSWRPIACAVGGGVLSFAFAAPRLLPMLDMMRRYPRLVDSPESMDLSGFVGVFTAKEPNHPAVGPWGWHEFGIYTGWVPFFVMLVGLFFAARARERALRLAGVICLVLAFGRFHPYAPWALLHDHAPLFESQHVPSRWLYPALLVLLVAASGIVERILARQTWRGWLEVALLSLAAYVGLDIGLEAQRPLVGAFARRMNAPFVDSDAPFHQERITPPSLRYDAADWAPPNMPSMVANVGVIDCNTFPGFNTYYRGRSGGLPGLGAKGRGDDGYRGEVYLTSPRASSSGQAQIEEWSPNVVVVSVTGATPGDVLVLNQNWDPGWNANGARTFALADTVATTITTPDERVTFRFIPRFLMVGLFLCLLAVFGIAWLARKTRQGSIVNMP